MNDGLGALYGLPILHIIPALVHRTVVNSF